jgi:hypothetical protein
VEALQIIITAKLEAGGGEEERQGGALNKLLVTFIDLYSHDVMTLRALYHLIILW